MKGDFSRDTFDVAKHFSRVLQQQGRVQLDADWNEQTAILLHYLRTLAADLIGPFAGPAGDENCGFKISVKNNNDLTIGKGRYYVDGILCENDGSKDVTYMTQNDLPSPPGLGNGNYLVYLDVWERHVTALEDQSIREKALNGVDTATRTQVVWQIKIWNVTLEKVTRNSILSNWITWVEKFQPSPYGCLKARVKPPKDSQDPCLTAPDAKYRGLENQLYRVEIHKSGKVGEATFKWSRDNGTIVTACELNGTELTVQNPHGFDRGQWVELTNDGLELRGEPGNLAKLTKVQGNTLTLDAAPESPAGIPDQEPWPTKVRRWDQHEAKDIQVDKDGVHFGETDEETWIALEDGIQIQFLKSNSVVNHYRIGDFWLIPARVLTGNIEWPEEDESGNMIPACKPPNEIRHHYAPLAILKYNGSAYSVDDLRCEFHPLNNTCDPSGGSDDEEHLTVRIVLREWLPGGSAQFIDDPSLDIHFGADNNLMQEEILKEAAERLTQNVGHLNYKISKIYWISKSLLEHKRKNQCIEALRDFLGNQLTLLEEDTHSKFLPLDKVNDLFRKEEELAISQYLESDPLIQNLIVLEVNRGLN